MVPRALVPDPEGGLEMAINGLTPQSTALSLLKSAGGLFKTDSALAAKQQKQADTLMAALEKSDPARAQALKQERERLGQTIAQLQSSRSDVSAERKEAARQKIEQLKAKIQALRMMAAADPKAAARQAAQLGRELAAATKEYASAGGSATETAAVSASGTEVGVAEVSGAVSDGAGATGQAAAATSGQENAQAVVAGREGTPVAAVDAAGSQAAAPETAPGLSRQTAAKTTMEAQQVSEPGAEGEEVAEVAAGEVPDDAAADDATESTQDNKVAENGFAAAKEKLDQEIAHAKKRLGESDADSAFATEARRLMNELKNIIKSASEKLKGADGANDVAAAKKAFSEIEKSLNEITSGALSTAVASAIDILV